MCNESLIETIGGKLSNFMPFNFEVLAIFTPPPALHAFVAMHSVSQRWGLWVKGSLYL